MKNDMKLDNTEMENEIDRKISEKYMKNCPGFGNDVEIDVMEPEKTVEETYAKRHSKIQYSASSIDIDNAEWQQEYAKRMNKNLERFKELGLYKQLQDIGIIYDEKQFQRTYGIGHDEKGHQTQTNLGRNDSYDDIESQFDDIEEKIEEKNKKNEKSDGKKDE